MSRERAKLRHPNFLTLHGVMMDEQNRPLMVIEYADFGNLASFIHNTTMQIETEIVISILHDIVSGMRFLHAIASLHGDLKPTGFFFSIDQYVLTNVLLLLYSITAALLHYCCFTPLLLLSVRAGSVLELDVRLNSVSFHKEFRKETGKHGQMIILGQFEISRW